MIIIRYSRETFPTFIKLWGHIDQTLEAGVAYNLTIQNNYDVSEFDGHKYVYFSEVNSLGGTNKFLGIAFLGMAGVVFLIMVIFTILYFVRLKGKDIYSTENLKW